MVPLATTEAALVASYNRGAQLVSEAGGCSAVLLNEGISRAPGFAFCNLQECGLFVVWASGGSMHPLADAGAGFAPWRAASAEMVISENRNTTAIHRRLMNVLSCSTPTSARYRF